MSSSKFSSRPPARKRPAICKPSPRATPPGQLPVPPVQLHTFVDWKDLDPLAPGWQTASFLSLWFPAGKYFYGESAPSGDRTTIFLIQDFNVNYYTAFLRLWDTYRFGELFIYPGLYVEPDKPFQTPKFGDVNLSGIDFRIGQLAE